MTKTLIIITRPSDEYDKFWGFNNNPVITPKEIDGNSKVIIIKRNQDRKFDAYCNIIADQLGVNLTDEIGIIIHSVNGDNDANRVRDGLTDEIRAKLKFCTWYSSTKTTFWNENDLSANRPYNMLRKAIKSGNGQSAALNKVWDFFLGDPLLEAKLTLLQNILNGEKPSDDILFLLGKELTGFENDFEKFKKTPNSDIFSCEYQTAFKIFRDKLGVE